MKKYTCHGQKCPKCGLIVPLTEKDEAPHYCYKCPVCHVTTGADEWREVENARDDFTWFKDATPAEIISRFAEIQRERKIKLCPRCGGLDMNDEPARNALSRRADVQICDLCGLHEAVRDVTAGFDDLSYWVIVKAVKEM